MTTNKLTTKELNDYINKNEDTIYGILMTTQVQIDTHLTKDTVSIESDINDRGKTREFIMDFFNLMECWSCTENGKEEANLVIKSDTIDDSQYCDECKLLCAFETLECHTCRKPTEQIVYQVKDIILAQCNDCKCARDLLKVRPIEEAN